MKLWIVNQYAITPSQAGPMRHYDLARELVQHGHAVTIVASSFDHFAHTENRLASHESFRVEFIDGIRYLWLRSPEYNGNNVRRIWNMVHFAVSLLRKARHIEDQTPDVVIGSSPPLFAAWGAERLARKFAVPFVLEVRDLWPQSLVELGNVSRRHPMVTALSLIERHLYRSASHVISLLPDAAEHISTRGGKANAISWLPNGVKLDAFAPSTVQESGRPFVVLYAGAHSTANPLDSVLDAASILDRNGLDHKIQIHLVGNGPHKAHLQARALDEKLRSVRFFSEVPRNLVGPLMSQADALLMPLRRTDLYKFGISPNKLFHYMAAARPVIITTGAPYNPVRDARAGITVPAEDPEALAAGMQALATLPGEERLAMGLRARAYVEENHKIERIAQELEEILLGMRPAAAVPSLRSLEQNI